MTKRRRSKKRSAERLDDERVTVFHDGSCAPGVCKGETACKNIPNNKYTCLCPHDSQPPTAAGTCPRRIVNEQPGRIPNVQPPSIKLHLPVLNQNTTPASVETTSFAPSEKHPFAAMTSNSTILISVGVLAIIITILGYFLHCQRQRRKRQNQVNAPVKLKLGLLNAERYSPNPQYSACTGADIPVLRKKTLIFVSKLGEGCFGEVHKGKLVLENSNTVDIVAIKVLKESASKEAEENFYREVEIMRGFKHPNILTLLGVVLGEGTTGPMMVFEYMQHGDLAELLRDQKRIPEEGKTVPQLAGKDLLHIALQIANGMEYLAARRFVHRDLACRNCLVAEGITVKIADFGMSRDVYFSEYYKMERSRLLPVRWMSPESVLYSRFTLESDVWSYGVVLWEIYSLGKQPYYGHNNEQVIELIRDGILLIPPEDCPPQICDLMKNCWKTEPKHRITFTDIKEKLEDYSTLVGNTSDHDLCNNSLNKTFATTSTSWLKYENEGAKSTSKYNSTNESKLKSLPRPPPITQLSREDLLDSQGYLLPNDIKEPVQYLRTLPE